MKEREICANCNYFDKYGMCRFNPPIRLPRRFDERATKDSRVRDERLIWGWPIVNPTDWCGQWQDVDF
jgi:hypothetical protein